MLDQIKQSIFNEQNETAMDNVENNDEYLKQLENSKENAKIIVSKKWYRVYWILFLILCMLLIESLFKSGIALGTIIWFALAEIIAISFAKYSTGKLNKKALLLCIPIGLMNLSHLMFYNLIIGLGTFHQIIIKWTTIQ